MKRVLYVFKSIIICVCVGIILGFFAMAAVWLFSENKPGVDKCLYTLRIGAAIGAFAAAAVRLIYAICDNHPISKALSLSKRGENIDEAFELVRHKAAKTHDPKKKSTYMLVLSALYTENERYDDALETLRKTDFNELPYELMQEYFNAYMYTYLQMGDTENADRVYSEAQPYFKSPAPSVLHTLGVYEYARGNYGKARSYLLQSRTNDDSDRNVCDCDLYLALCALKEGKVNDAKALADEAGELFVTKNEEKNLAKLLTLIEKYEQRLALPKAEGDEPEQTEQTEQTEQATNERTTDDD